MLRPVLLALLAGSSAQAFAQPASERVPLLRDIKEWVVGCDNLRNCHALSAPSGVDEEDYSSLTLHIWHQAGSEGYLRLRFDQGPATPGAVPSGSLTFRNNVTVSSSETNDGYDPDMANNTAIAPFQTVLPNADLELYAKYKSPSPVAPGANITSTIIRLPPCARIFRELRPSSSVSDSIVVSGKKNLFIAFSAGKKEACLEHPCGKKSEFLVPERSRTRRSPTYLTETTLHQL